MQAIDAVHGPPGAVPSTATAQEVADVLAGANVDALAPSGRCLRCGSNRLRLVDVPGGPNFLCLMCRRCWQPEDGYLAQVNPYACSGCRYRSFCLLIAADAR